MEHDLNNINDFINICSSGNICPNASIEMRNLTRDNIIHKPFLDHSIQLCNSNNTDLLTLLTGIHDKINNNMVTVGENVPIIKNKINKVISEWPQDLTYEDIFQKKDRQKFNYKDVVDCNNKVLDINNKMGDLKTLIQNDGDNIYESIQGLENDCDNCDKQIHEISSKLDNSIEDYEIEYPQILMDLSTKQKPFYHIKDSDELAKVSNDRSYHKIPDRIEKIILNLLLISNMISKEYSYIKTILNKLKLNINDKKEIITKVKSDIPPKTSPLTFSNITDFFDSLIANNDQEHLKEDKDKQHLKETLQKLDSEKVLIDSLLEDTSNELRASKIKDEDDTDNEEEDTDEDTDEDEADTDGEEEEIDEEREEEETGVDLEDSGVDGGGTRNILNTSEGYRLKFF